MIGAIAALMLSATAPIDIGAWYLTRHGSTCAIQAASDNQTFIKIEVDARGGSYFMSVSTLAWNDIEDRKTYKLGFTMVDHPPLRTFIATGVTDAARPRSIILFALTSRPSDSILVQLGHSKRLTFELKGKPPLQIDTGGLPNGMVLLSNCRKDGFSRSPVNAL